MDGWMDGKSEYLKHSKTSKTQTLSRCYVTDNGSKDAGKATEGKRLGLQRLNYVTSSSYTLT